MRVKTIAILGVAAFLGLAPQAFAMGSGGHGHDGATVSGSYNGTTFTGTCSGGHCSGTLADGTMVSGDFAVQAAEPLSALAVGLGLLGARYFRRRQ